jgi:hypothetical protein
MRKHKSKLTYDISGNMQNAIYLDTTYLSSHKLNLALTKLRKEIHIPVLGHLSKGIDKPRMEKIKKDFERSYKWKESRDLYMYFSPTRRNKSW